MPVVCARLAERPSVSALLFPSVCVVPALRLLVMASTHEADEARDSDVVLLFPEKCDMLAPGPVLLLGITVPSDIVPPALAAAEFIMPCPLDDPEELPWLVVSEPPRACISETPSC